MRRLTSGWLVMCALVVGCSGESSEPVDQDAGSDGSDGSPGLDGGGDGSDGSDAGSPGDDGGVACAVGDTITGSFGPQGGDVTLCGASVSLAPDLLTEARAVTLRVVALPSAAPFPLEAAGLAFEVRVEGGVPSAPNPPLSILVPRAPSTRYPYFYRYDASEGFQQIEACTVTDTTIGQAMSVDGTYVALVDTEDFPTPSEELGSGTLQTTFGEAVSDFDLASEDFSTFAIYDQGPDGSRNVVLSATRMEGEDTRRMRMSFHIDAQGAAELIEISYGLLSEGLWGYLPFDGTKPTFTLTTNDGAHVAGSFSATVRQGDVTAELSGTFDATAGKYRFPPELACNAPEG